MTAGVMQSAWNAVRRWPWHLEWRGFIYLNPATWMMLIQQVVITTSLCLFDRDQVQLDGPGVLRLLLTLAGILAWAQAINTLFLSWPRARYLLHCLTLILSGLMAQYRAETGVSLEWAVLRDNLWELAYAEAATMMMQTTTLWSIGLAVAGTLVSVPLEWRYRLLAGWIPPRRPGRLLVTGVAVYLMVLVLPWPPHSELAFFFHTLVRDLVAQPRPLDSAWLVSRGIDPAVPYPLFRATPPAPAPAQAAEPPHVFLVMMESFPGLYVERRTSDGREVTPVFNRLSKEGVVPELFWGNSVQTAKGQFVTLCGVPPAYRAKEYAAYPTLRVPCLPHVLKQAGYRTIFMSAFNDLGYDNTGTFLRQHGFEVAQATDVQQVPENERLGKVWGWGLQDDAFFVHAFRELDRQVPAREGRRDPVFMTLATISHHMRFDALPEPLRHLHPSPQGMREQFENSLHFADSALQAFFTELNARPDLRSNSLVVLVADHSFPAGEHGSTYNQVGAWEEHFRAPALLWWPGHLAPRRLGGVGTSQLDLAPTILKLVGRPAPSTMLGRDILDPDAPPTPVFLTQPYDGIHLGVIVWPYKLTYHMRTNQHRLVRLDQDPLERNDLAADPAHSDARNTLERELGVLVFIQRLMQEDRLWPPDQPL